MDAITTATVLFLAMTLLVAEIRWLARSTKAWRTHHGLCLNSPLTKGGETWR